MRRGSIGTAVILLAVLAAGCGGGGASVKRSGGTSTSRGTSSTTSSTSSSVPTQTTQRLPNPTADRALAQSAVLTIADLPAGWTGEPHVTTSYPELDQDIATCLQVPTSAINTDLAPHADSPDFSQLRAGTTFAPTLANGVAIYPSKEQASVILDTASKPNFPSCTATGLRNELRRQGGVSGATASAVFLPIAPIGERSIAVQTHLVNGPVSTFADVLLAQRGRAIVFVVGGSGLEQADPALEAALLEKVVVRVGAAAS